MSATVSVANDSQSIRFDDTIGDGHGDKAYCGTRTYVLTPNYPFLTILGETMTLSSTDPAQVGTYNNVKLTVSLPVIWARPSIDVLFNV